MNTVRTPLSIIDKVKCAINGLMYGFTIEPNIRIMIPIAGIVNLVISLLGYPNYLLVVVMSFITISMEYMNTSIEMLSDALCPEINVWIGMLKDIAGGSVLLMVICDLMISIDILLWMVSTDILWLVIT